MNEKFRINQDNSIQWKKATYDAFMKHIIRKNFLRRPANGSLITYKELSNQIPVQNEKAISELKHGQGNASQKIREGRQMENIGTSAHSTLRKEYSPIYLCGFYIYYCE